MRRKILQWYLDFLLENLDEWWNYLPTTTKKQKRVTKEKVRGK